MRTSFFTYFTSAYGALWLVAVLLAFIGGLRVELGWLGRYGFPIIALIYAGYRRAWDSDILASQSPPS